MHTMLGFPARFINFRNTAARRRGRYKPYAVSKAAARCILDTLRALPKAPDGSTTNCFFQRYTPGRPNGNGFYGLHLVNLPTGPVIFLDELCNHTGRPCVGGGFINSLIRRLRKINPGLGFVVDVVINPHLEAYLRQSPHWTGVPRNGFFYTGEKPSSYAIRKEKKRMSKEKNLITLGGLESAILDRLPGPVTARVNALGEAGNHIATMAGLNNPRAAISKQERVTLHAQMGVMLLAIIKASANIGLTLEDVAGESVKVAGYLKARTEKAPEAPAEPRPSINLAGPVPGNILAQEAA